MSSLDERSPKRQRRSYSPESPLPETSKTAPPAQPPQTPPPSVHMSPSWQAAPLPGLGQISTAAAAPAAAPAPSTTTQASFPSPPSTAGLQSQNMGRVTSAEGRTGESAQHTPSSEAENQRAGLGDQVMRDAASKDEGNAADVTMADDDDDDEEEEEHRRTDHERQEAGDVVPPLPSSNVLYKLAVEPIAPTRPLFSQNAIELYNLQHIQASVARKDAAGVKINKLRKSYEGKVNQLKLEGRNKPTKQEGWFTGLLHPGWDVQFEDGRTMWEIDHEGSAPGNPESDGKIFALLDSALDMRSGHLPKKEHEEWRHLTGLDEPVGLAAAKPSTAGGGAPGISAFGKPALSGPSRPVGSAGSAAVATAAQHHAVDSPKGFGNSSAVRPDRQGKKRRYDERSYEGYNDGYDDDGYDTAGMDEAGRRGSGGKRQKRKDFTPSNSPPFTTTGNAGGGMVGVRSS